MLETWTKESPDFNLDKLHAPVRIEAISGGPLPEWEFYAGLKSLGQPVEMVDYPDGEHELVKPRQRLTSLQGTLDWFYFWLKGEEDPDPAKAKQYKRWRELRKLQEANQATKRPN